MKLKFQCNKVLIKDWKYLLPLCVLFLEKNNYRVIRKTLSNVSFSDDISGRLVLNTSYYARVDEGDIEFFEVNKKTEVVLTFRLSITPILIQLFIIALVGVSMDYALIGFSILPIIGLLLNIQIVRNNFINDILNVNKME